MQPYLVEEEEEQVSVTVLKLDVWQLSSNNSSYLQLIIDQISVKI